MKQFVLIIKIVEFFWLKSILTTPSGCKWPKSGWQSEHKTCIKNDLKNIKRYQKGFKNDYQKLQTGFLKRPQWSTKAPKEILKEVQVGSKIGLQMTFTKAQKWSSSRV